MAGVVTPDAFRQQPSLRGTKVRLEPLTAAVMPEYLRAMNEPEVTRLTGTHATFEPSVVEEWLATRAVQHDRADWAILRAHDGAFLGEAVLNDLDPDNESASFRIWLGGPEIFGHGYGTESTRLVVDYAFGEVGLHRLTLEVFEHNPRARRVYEKCGFIVEGRLREALLWDGRRYDAIVMAQLRTEWLSARS